MQKCYFCDEFTMDYYTCDKCDKIVCHDCSHTDLKDIGNGVDDTQIICSVCEDSDVPYKIEAQEETEEVLSGRLV